MTKVAGVICFGISFFCLPASGQQPELKVSNSHPDAGQVVVIELTQSSDPGAKLALTRSCGLGEFTSETTNQRKVCFQPHKPNDVVIIVCEIKTAQGQTQASTKLYVSGQPAAPAAAPARHAGDAAARSDALKIDDITGMVPSGYMGDATSEHGGTVNLDNGNKKNCHEEAACYRLEYNQGAVGDAGWAAIGWQYVTVGGANWGDDPGADLHAKGFQSLRIWASGEAAKDGKYPKVQFKSGGNTKPKADHAASFAVSSPTVQLGAQPAEFCLDLTGRDLTNVVSPFTVVVTKGANPAGAVVIMSDIHYSTQPCEH